jgi:hypothetical protein
MNTDQLHVERRAAQRFPFQLTVAIRLLGSDLQGSGFTQDLSARGALLYTDLMPSEGEAIELTLIMPSEITLAESMPVCCRGKVVRVTQLESRYAVAVHIETYEFLPETRNSTQATGSFARIAALHSHRAEEETAEFVSPQSPTAS